MINYAHNYRRKFAFPTVCRKLAIMYIKWMCVCVCLHSHRHGDKSERKHCCFVKQGWFAFIGFVFTVMNRCECGNHRKCRKIVTINQGFLLICLITTIDVYMASDFDQVYLLYVRLTVGNKTKCLSQIDWCVHGNIYNLLGGWNWFAMNIKKVVWNRRSALGNVNRSKRCSVTGAHTSPCPGTGWLGRTDSNISLESVYTHIGDVICNQNNIRLDLMSYLDWADSLKTAECTR